MNKKIFFLLSTIIIIASLLRLWQLGEVPVSPDWDEVALGYNAYSIMQTGKDEYGQFLPVVLRSFDDYKPALYTYLTIPSIKVFGLNAFAVRLPSAIFGILTVLASYFLVIKLFNKPKIALLTSFLLAISPWHIQFSRIAFESNVGLAFNIFAFILFIKGLKKPYFLLLSVVFMALNIYVYQSEKVFVPLIFILLVIIFRKELLNIPKKYIFGSLILGVLFVMPMFSFMLSNKDALARAQGVSIFSQETIMLKNNIERLAREEKNNDILGVIFDNRRVVYGKAIVANYLSHFDPNWLFIRGDFELDRHHAPNMGLLYLFEFPFLLVGIYVLMFGAFLKEVDTKNKIFIFFWFLSVPIAASITTGVPHSVRTLNFLPVFQIFSALGIIVFLSSISNIKYQILNIKIKYFIFAVSFLFFIFNFSYYLDQYFVQQNYYYSKSWQYGYEELVDYLKPIHNNYKKVIVSNRHDLSQSYMFFLFYLKYSPKEYLSVGGSKSGGFEVDTHKFSNFEFRPFDYYKENQGKVLLVGTPSDFPEEFHVIKTINYLDGTLAYKVVEKN